MAFRWRSGVPGTQVERHWTALPAAAYRPLTRYLVAVLAVALATLFTLLLWPLMKPAAMPLFFAAVMVSAWAGGLGPGLLATGLSALTMEYVFMASLYAQGRWYEGVIRVEIFVLVALVISALNAARRRAEAVAEDAHRFFQSALDSLSARIAVIDGSGTIVAVNAAWRRAADADGSAAAGRGVIGTSYLDVWKAGAESQGAAIGRGIEEVLGNRRREFFGEYADRGAAGERWFGVRATRFEGEGPLRVAVAHEDITERKRAEEAERRAEILQSVTRLARAAAHEINNPLAIVMGNVEIVGQQVSPDNTPRIRLTLEAIDRIREILARMSRMTELKLHEQSSSLPEMLDLGDTGARRETD
jgi:PAS domain S-box-containing protein